MKIFADRPFRLYDYGPSFPAVMRVMISMISLALYIRMFMIIWPAGWTVNSACIMIVYPISWWAYVRLERELAGNKRGVVLLDGLMICILLMAIFYFRL